MERGVRRRSRRTWFGVLTVLLLGGLLAGVTTDGASAKAYVPQVLYVKSPTGSSAYDSIATPASQTFSTIQDAVSAAHKGDWILIAPGDYHETGDMGANAPSASDLATGWYGAVDVETPDIHIRGMDRNGVIVDGTLASAATPCSSNAADQNLLGGDGRNGIMVWKAKNVSIDNLTVCNFLNGTLPGTYGGNGIWWNGGGNLTGKIGLKGYSGSYLTATSTYFVNDDPGGGANVCNVCGLYGIFASAAKGPATLDQVYANNFSDSGIYVGACRKVCNVTIDQAWMENNALGYSGTNSGGAVVVENSTFDNNKDGFDTNTALTGDPPPPQDGKCPGKSISPITGTNASCWVFMDNLVENNNNPDVPISGTAGLGPTGTGMTVSGGRDDTIMNNKFVGNGAWGVLFVPYPDGNLSSMGKTCTGTKGLDATGLAQLLGISGLSCLYDPMGDHLVDNQFSGNGTFGNPPNADYGNLLVGGHEVSDCFSGNTEWDSTFTTQLGPATDASVVDGSSALQTPADCITKTAKTGLLGANTDLGLLVQVECDAGLLSGSSCSNAVYPQATGVTMQPLPSLPTMPDPCLGVPTTSVWCPGGVPAASRQN